MALGRRIRVLIASLIVVLSPFWPASAESKFGQTSVPVPGGAATIAQAKAILVADPAGALEIVDRLIASATKDEPPQLSKIEACWLKAQALSRLGRNKEALEVVNPAIENARRILFLIPICRCRRIERFKLRS